MVPRPPRWAVINPHSSWKSSRLSKIDEEDPNTCRVMNEQKWRADQLKREKMIKLVKFFTKLWTVHEKCLLTFQIRLWNPTCPSDHRNTVEMLHKILSSTRYLLTGEYISVLNRVCAFWFTLKPNLKGCLRKASIATEQKLPLAWLYETKSETKNVLFFQSDLNELWASVYTSSWFFRPLPLLPSKI